MQIGFALFAPLLLYREIIENLPTYKYRQNFNLVLFQRYVRDNSTIHPYEKTSQTTGKNLNANAK